MTGASRYYFPIMSSCILMFCDCVTSIIDRPFLKVVTCKSETTEQAKKVGGS